MYLLRYVNDTICKTEALQSKQSATSSSVWKQAQPDHGNEGSFG